MAYACTQALSSGVLQGLDNNNKINKNRGNCITIVEVAIMIINPQHQVQTWLRGQAGRHGLVNHADVVIVQNTQMAYAECTTGILGRFRSRDWGQGFWFLSSGYEISRFFLGPLFLVPLVLWSAAATIRGVAGARSEDAQFTASQVLGNILRKVRAHHPKDT